MRDEISDAAGACGREADSVRLVAVTKGHPVGAAQAARALGIRDLGENRVMELEAKVGAVGREGLRWHMIGHLQSRKAPTALAVADLIHSVDSVRLAERLDRSAEQSRSRADVLVQVNTSGEDAKSGLAASEAVDAILAIAALPRITVHGLMTMAPFIDDEGVLRGVFGRLRETLDAVRTHDTGVGPELSMGMSNDLRWAVEEGSTMVRIGTALFGPRPGFD